MERQRRSGPAKVLALVGVVLATIVTRERAERLSTLQPLER